MFRIGPNQRRTIAGSGPMNYGCLGLSFSSSRCSGWGSVKSRCSCPTPVSGRCSGVRSNQRQLAVWVRIQLLCQRRCNVLTFRGKLGGTLHTENCTLAFSNHENDPREWSTPSVSIAANSMTQAVPAARVTFPFHRLVCFHNVPTFTSVIRRRWRTTQQEIQQAHSAGIAAICLCRCKSNPYKNIFQAVYRNPIHILTTHNFPSSHDALATVFNRFSSSFLSTEVYIVRR